MIALYNILLQYYLITWLAHSNTSLFKSIVLQRNIDISGSSPTLYIFILLSWHNVTKNLRYNYYLYHSKYELNCLQIVDILHYFGLELLSMGYLMIYRCNISMIQQKS